MLLAEALVRPVTARFTSADYAVTRARFDVRVLVRERGGDHYWSLKGYPPFVAAMIDRRLRSGGYA